MKKILMTILIAILLGFVLSGCTGDMHADRASVKLSKESANFNVIQRLTVISVKTEEPMYEIIGALSIKRNVSDNSLTVLVKTDEDEYKRHFVALNEWTMHIVEDIRKPEENEYVYEVNYLPEKISSVVVTDNE